MGGANGAGVQIHCNCFDDASLANCPENGAAPPPPPCYDTLPQQKCMDLYQRGKCSRSKALNGCRYTCGWCGGCPSSRVGSPSPPPFAAGCEWPYQANSYSLITKKDATLSSHSHYKGLAIGGTLYDSSPLQFGTAGSKSFVTDIGSAGPYFNWADGITTGQPLPFMWGAFQNLANVLIPSDQIIVIDQGGAYTGAWPPVATYSMDTFCMTTSTNSPANTCQSSSTGYNKLVVFKGAGTVGLGGTVTNIPFQPTVLAPWAHVIALGSTSYVDGTVIAKSFESQQGCDQMHAYLYNGPMLCEAVMSAGGCTDIKSVTWCNKKLSQNKCWKTNVKNKCALTCGLCTA